MFGVLCNVCACMGINKSTWPRRACIRKKGRIHAAGACLGMGVEDPILVGECFVRDFRTGRWDEFSDLHVALVCDRLLERGMCRVDWDAMQGGELERSRAVMRDVMQIRLSCTPGHGGEAWGRAGSW